MIPFQNYFFHLYLNLFPNRGFTRTFTKFYKTLGESDQIYSTSVEWTGWQNRNFNYLYLRITRTYIFRIEKLNLIDIGLSTSVKLCMYNIVWNELKYIAELFSGNRNSIIMYLFSAVLN